MLEFKLTQENYSLVSSKIPLILSLNIVENIALIKEVHIGLSVDKAEGIAKESLEKIGLLDIALMSIDKCSDLEIFYVMFIRALMMNRGTILVESPYLILEEIINIEILDELNQDKDIIILDTFENETKYEDYRCNIIR